MLVLSKMFLKKISHTNLRFILTRSFHQSQKVFSEKEYENPVLRTFRILSNDILKPLSELTKNDNNARGLISGIPSHADIVIVGGGATGSSIAYWLKEKSNEHAFSVVVIEKDLTYANCSTCLSVGGLRQQFSLPENVQMSLYGAEFIRTLKKRFGPEADVNFTPHGNLILANEADATQLIDNSKLQKELGAVNMVLHKHQLKDRFPWLNVDDIEIGCLGLEKEGWFNAWSLLKLLKKGAAEKNSHYINANVVDFTFENRSDLIIEGIQEATYEQPRQVVIEMPDGERKTINFAICIIAAGAESGKIAEQLKIGTGSGMLSVPVPIERRTRFVSTFSCEDEPPGLNTPFTVDPTGVYFRREGLGGDFIAGVVTELNDKVESSSSEVTQNFWDSTVWPILAHRVPAFNSVKLKKTWSGSYEYNRYDHNGIIGPHPYYTNIYVATGFSGHGIQQAPAVGRAVAELILDGKFQTIDLTRLGFDRFLLDKPMYETETY